MSIFDELFSSHEMINEQVAHEVFNLLPEDDMFLVIRDSQGSNWISDTEKYERYFCGDTSVNLICQRIDDGEELILSSINGCGVAGGLIRNQHDGFGYAIICQPSKDTSGMLFNVETLELSLKLISLVASLVSKNNYVHHASLNRRKIGSKA